MSTVFIPAVLRPNVGGVKSLEVDGGSIRGESSTRSSSATRRSRPAADRRRRPQPVRQRLRQRPGRALPRRARHAGRPDRRGPPAAGDGRRLTRWPPVAASRRRARPHATPTPTRTGPHGGRYDDILDAIGHTPLVEIPRMSPNPDVRHLRQARDAQPDRLGQGPRREVPDRGPRGARAARRATRSSSSRRRATPASPWR